MVLEMVETGLVTSGQSCYNLEHYMISLSILASQMSRSEPGERLLVWRCGWCRCLVIGRPGLDAVENE